MHVTERPIHYAAQQGYEDIVMMLVDDFNVEPSVVSFVRLHAYIIMCVYKIKAFVCCQFLICSVDMQK